MPEDRRQRFLPLLILLLVLLTAQGVQAQPQTGSEPVDRIEQYYLEGRLDKAELEALRLLNRPTGLTEFERGELYRILGFSSVARDDTDQAKQYFRSAFQHNPNMRLDRNLTSPKILSVFDEARIEFKQVRILDREALVNDLKSYRLRVEGGVRSLLFPGLGQLHKGHKLRGNMMLGATGIAIVGLVYSHVMVLDAEDRYNRSEDPISAQSNYDDFLTYWQWRYSFGYAIAAVWIGSTLDAFLSPPDESAFDRITIELAYDPESRTPMAGLAFHF
ncbi:hypothetical protein KQI52_04440 [bacterium]|nr:hypothetical protein [bacterium]